MAHLLNTCSGAPAVVLFALGYLMGAATCAGAVAAWRLGTRRAWRPFTINEARRARGLPPLGE